jgi:hypothetical protein
MIDTENQFEFVTRQFGAYFLGISVEQFDIVVTKESPVEFKRNGRNRRFKFADLARMLFPDATEQDIQVMRIIANIHFAGVKRGKIKLEMGTEKTTNQKK